MRDPIGAVDEADSSRRSMSDPAGPPPTAPLVLGAQDASDAGAVMFTFAIRESHEPSGLTRIALIGELDILHTASLSRHLEERLFAGSRILLDLSALEFIDSAGVKVLLDALHTAARAGAALEIDRRLQPQVRRTLALLQLEETLLGPGASDPRRD